MKIIFAFDFVTPIYDNRDIIPIGLLSLATLLKQDGHVVEVVDLNEISATTLASGSHDGRYERLAGYIVEKEPSIVGFTTMCGSFHTILLLAQEIKKMNCQIKVILGGPQASSVPAETIQAFPCIDLVVIGEGEKVIGQAIAALVTGDLATVPGIAYREQEIVVINPPAGLIDDLDSLPMIDLDLIKNRRWRVTMEVGRGCPFSCVFCNTSSFWRRKFRVKSVERIGREIEAIKEVAGCPLYITFVDDNFTTDYKYTLRLCAKLGELGIHWNCDARLDTLDERLIAAMAASGCDSVLMGIESGSPRMQKLINKNLDLTTIDKVIDLLVSYKMKPILSFMYGFPDENDADVRLTLELIYGMLKKGVYICALHSLAVLAGTALYEACAGRLVMKEYYSDLTDAADFESCREFISAHPALFPHFYTLTGSTAERYRLLDRFINYILIKLYSYFPRSFDAIIGYFGGDILLFYKDFVTSEEGFGKFFLERETVSAAVAAKNLTPRMIGFLFDYISGKAAVDICFKVFARTAGGELEQLEQSIARLRQSRPMRTTDTEA